MPASATVAHRPALAHAPLAFLALSFAAGIVIANLCKASLTAWLSSAVISSILLFYFYAKRKQALATLLIALAFLSAGATLSVIEKRSVSQNRVQRFFEEGAIHSGEPVELTGALESAPEPAPDGFYLALRVEKLRIREEEKDASGVVWLFAPVRERRVGAEYEALELRYGARLRLMTALRRAESFRNPGVSSFTEYLEQRGFDATGTIKSPLLIERLEDERVFLPLAWLYEWRQRLLAQFDRKFSRETAGVLAASLLGNRYKLSHEAAERFRAGGTFHVLVISGLHISFIGLVALALMRRLTRNRAWQFAASISLLWAYTLVVGAESSVVRAALMFTLMTLAPVLNRRASSLNALGGACLALLAWRPSELFDPSFQLTFLSVLAIVALAWPVLLRLQEAGAWRPNGETPHPPVCARWWRLLGEMLFWSEREWQKELKLSVWHCRLFKTPWAARLEKLHVQKLLRYIFGTAVVSIAVQLTLLPFLVLYFHRLSMAAIFLNVIVGVSMALLSFVSLAALLVSQLSQTVAAPLFTLAEGLSWLMIHSASPFMRLRVASIRLPEYHGAAAAIYGLYYLPLCILTLMLARWHPLRQMRQISKEQGSRLTGRAVVRFAVCGQLLALFFIVAHPLSAGRPDGRLRIDFLDVGQGDAALVTLPDGVRLLIDGGGRPRFAGPRGRVDEEVAVETFERDARSIGEAVVSEYLWWRGLSEVDYLLATHADADHIDGLCDVARNFSVRGALVARAPTLDAEYARFAATLHAEGVPVHFIARGDSLRFGDVTIDVLWPVRAFDENAASSNEDSVVLRLRFGERVFLLTGDIEKKSEAALAAAPDELRADVVKVAHHGSRTSSTENFVKATRPALAIISVGLFSIYGHPHPTVVERWRAGGAEVLTTGESGTISVSTDGRDLRIETYAQSNFK
jgi:competence protein ComEC